MLSVADEYLQSDALVQRLLSVKILVPLQIRDNKKGVVRIC